jgi:hypothetical protein
MRFQFFTSAACALLPSTEEKARQEVAETSRRCPLCCSFTVTLSYSVVVATAKVFVLHSTIYSLSLFSRIVYNCVHCFLEADLLPVVSKLIIQGVQSEALLDLKFGCVHPVVCIRSGSEDSDSVVRPSSGEIYIGY